MYAESGEGTLVIAHSMGGLVALHALATCPNPLIFSGIIFGSTPFAGTLNIVQPFKHGDSIILNKEICSPSTVFSFRSSFYLLPSDEAGFQSTEGKKRNVDFLSVEDWSRYGLSPMTEGILNEGVGTESRQEKKEEARTADGNILEQGSSAVAGIEEMGQPSTSTTAPPRADTATPDAPSSSSDPMVLSYLHRTLANVQKFREELASGYDANKRRMYPPLVILASTKTPTVKGCIIDTDEELRSGQYDRLLFGEGGKRALHALPPRLPPDLHDIPGHRRHHHPLFSHFSPGALEVASRRDSRKLTRTRIDSERYASYEEGAGSHL